MSGIANPARAAIHTTGRIAACAAVALLFLGAAAWTNPRPADLTLTGRVVDDGTGAALAGAQVYLQNTGRGTLTDRDGRYTLVVPAELLNWTELTLVVELIGYAPARSTLDSLSELQGRTVELDFRLRPEAVVLGEVQVQAGQAPGDRSSGYRPTAQMGRGVAARPGTPLRHPDWNREQYAHIEENDFRAVTAEPLSTFSIDVDRASYSNVRRFLRQGRLPPVDAVQVEEMINYFQYAYEMPDGDEPFAVTTELGAAPWRPKHRILRIGLASRPLDTSELPPSNLVFLLDVSGSMHSPAKLPLVKRALRLLVDQLRPEDRVAIVVYAGAAGLVLESTPGSDKERILDAIGRLRAGGSTAGGAGLELAYRVARQNFREGGNNRVILATDGDFNVGPSSDSEMIRLVEERRDQGTFLTVLGFGTGNLQSAKMQGLAQHGNGNYAYIDTLAEARKVLVSEMGSTLLTVARDVKLQVEFNPTRVRAYRLIGYENRLLANEDFSDDTRDAGDLGAGHRVTALYEVIPTGVESEVEVRTRDPLRYRREGSLSNPTSGAEVAFVRARYKTPRGQKSRLLEHPVRAEEGPPSPDLRFATAVAGFGMLLRQSEHRGEITPTRVLELAREGLGPDPHGYRREFVRMVQRYRELARDTDR